MFPGLPKIPTVASVLASIGQSQALAWSADFSMTTGDAPQSWGVLWNPAPCSIHLVQAQSFLVVTDSPAPGESFPQSRSGLVWIDCAVCGRNDTVGMRAMSNVRWTATRNGGTVPGYTNQRPSGTEVGVVNVAGIERANDSTGHLSMANRMPLLVQSGDRIGIDVRLSPAAPVGAIYGILLSVRGFSWLQR